MKDGFDLKTASLEIRKAAKALGIGSGRWKPVNHDRHIDALPDDTAVARVWNSRKSIVITAGDVKYASR
jgi:hypothetical protein